MRKKNKLPFIFHLLSKMKEEYKIMFYSFEKCYRSSSQFFPYIIDLIFAVCWENLCHLSA